MSYKVVKPIFQRETFPLKKQAVRLESPPGEEVRVAFSWQAARKWSPQSNNPQNTEHCQEPHKHGSRSYLSRASEETAALASYQRCWTQLDIVQATEPQELCNNKCVLFEATATNNKCSD